ncbi:ATP-binding protein [Sporomusa malonica]|uniref:Anti-sigma regulatory factor (Ser/Thr protein kinase) n=1 Tax=Sporomusa malonica TaxID=112901 RepID=A0A1W2DH11_9FIRM|nr:ATP-binding protein [Sporomusa malonica]SMC96228.1 Anti-sigma regulatory factor (Ser/Thr protein kinase) [Sporomusa malonica]
MGYSGQQAPSGPKAFPVFWDYSDCGQRSVVRHQIKHLLCKLTGEKAQKLELVLGEALSNANRHGSAIRLKINIIGSKLILRVRDNGAGFRGNARIAELAAVDMGQLFESLLTSERGRGIPLMMLWSDKLLYNKHGNEVMLINCLRDK